MKKVIIAPDSFKECISAVRAAQRIEEGFKRVEGWETLKIPMSDGGEGFTETMTAATGGQICHCLVTGPLGTPVEAYFGLLGDKKTAVLEMAAAAGLELVPQERRNPLYTTTYGLGELIIRALEAGAVKIIVGIGGSATNDGGAGMAQALGAKLLTKDGFEIALGAVGLHKLQQIKINSLKERLSKASVLVAADVDNPLCGPRGASFGYGRQKGAGPEMLPFLDRSLLHYANIIERELGIQIKDLPGAGAAGGLGGGMAAFLGAEIQSGVKVTLDILKMEDIMKQGIDLVITGEGQINGQTPSGKVPVGVASLAKKYNIPVIALAGSIGEGASEVLEHGIDAYFSIISHPMTLSDAISSGEKLLADLAEQIARLMR